MSSPKSARNALTGRPLRFLLVGFANTAVGLVAVYLAKLILGFGDILANAVGYGCGLAFGYFLNAAWTFEYRGRNTTAAGRFVLSFLVAYGVNLVTVWTAIHHLHLNGYLAQTIGILPYTATFYLLSKIFVFREPNTASGAAPGTVGSHGLSAVFATALAVLSGAALMFYPHTVLNQDSAWLLVSTGQFLDGARLYRDIIEINPPLIFYLTVPPVLVARLLQAAPETCFFVYTSLLAMVSLLLDDRLLRLSAASNAQRAGILAAIWIALFVMPLNVFGEREHLMLILALPYLLLAALRLSGGACTAGLAGSVGLLAALGFGLKPHFLIVPTLIEIYGFARWRSLRPILRPETVALAVGIAAYAAAIFVFHPEYISFIVPAGRLLYDTYDHDLGLLAAQLGALLPTLLLPIITYVVARRHGFGGRLSDVFAIAAVGFLAVFLIQAKGWFYHLLPALSALWLAVAVCIVTCFAQPRPSVTPSMRRLIGAAGTGALLILLSVPIRLGPYDNQYYDELLPAAREYGTGRTIYVFSAQGAVGFPLVNELHAQWGSRFMAQWLLPGVLRGLAEDPAGNASNRMQLQDIERYAVNAVIEDLRRTPPDLIIVDRSKDVYPVYVQIDFLAYFSRDPRFSAIWRNYAKIAATEHFDLWLRRSGEQRSNAGG